MSSLQALTVPKWGMSMEEGEIAQWHKSEGDSVAVGDDVVDIETSKIVNTVECTVAGTVVRVCAQSGEVLKVGALLAVVADGKADSAEIDAFVATFVPDAAAAALSDASASAGAATSPPTSSAPAQQAAPIAPPAVAPASELSKGPDDSEVSTN